MPNAKTRMLGLVLAGQAGIEQRLAESIELAAKLGGGLVRAEQM